MPVSGGYWRAPCAARSACRRIPGVGGGSRPTSGRRAARALDRIEREHVNFRAALDWLSDRGQLDGALELAASLILLPCPRGYAIEGRERLDTLLARADTRATKA
jgi:predicted ATPase